MSPFIDDCPSLTPGCSPSSALTLGNWPYSEDGGVTPFFSTIMPTSRETNAASVNPGYDCHDFASILFGSPPYGYGEHDLRRQ